MNFSERHILTSNEEGRQQSLKPKFLENVFLSNNGYLQNSKQTPSQLIKSELQSSSSLRSILLDPNKINPSGISQHNLQSTARENQMRTQFLDNKPLLPLQERNKALLQNNSSTISYLVSINKSVNNNSAKKLTNQTFSTSSNNNLNLTYNNSSLPSNQSSIQNHSKRMRIKLNQSQDIYINKSQFIEPLNFYSSSKNDQNLSREELVSQFSSNHINILNPFEPDSLHNNIQQKKIQMNRKSLKHLRKDESLSISNQSMQNSGSSFLGCRNNTSSKDRFAFQNHSPSIEKGFIQKEVKKKDFFTERIEKGKKYLSENQIITSIQSLNHEDITKFLQSEITLSNSTAFRSRADLKALINWFEKVNKLNEEENKYDIQMKRSKKLEIINSSFRELCNQIKTDFQEREQFFRMVWEENIKYYRSFIDEFELTRLKISTDADSEYNRLHDFYRQYIQSADAQAKQAKQEMQISQLEAIAAKKEIEMSNIQFQSIKGELNSFKKICSFLKKKLNSLQIENKNLHEKQNNRALYQKHQLQAEIKKCFPQNANENPAFNSAMIEKLTEQLRIANEGTSQVQVLQEEQIEIDSRMNNQEEGEEQEDDNQFVFEYNDGDNLVQGVDQLNAVIVNTENDIKKICTECQVEDDLKQQYTKEIEVQTDLCLFDNKYDALMFDNETIDDIFQFYAYKQQMDEMAISSDENNLMDLLREKSSQIPTNIEEIKEEGSNNNSRSSISSHSESSSSSDSETQKDMIPIKKGNSNQYDNFTNFEGRDNIRKRVSVQQNLFYSNRQLSLKLESYLSTAFVNDIFSCLYDLQPISQSQDPQPPSSIQKIKRMSFLDHRDSNPFIQKKRKEMKDKLNEIINPEKIKNVLEEAGLKVIFSSTENQMEKFLKIYKLTQFQSQELSVLLSSTQSDLNKITVELSQEKQSCMDIQKQVEVKQEVIEKQQETIRRLQEELEGKIAKEKEYLKAKGQETQEEESKEGTHQKVKNQPRIFKAPKKGGDAAFQLGKKVNMEWEFQKQSNQGKVIVEKAQDKKMVKFNNFMTIKTLLKQITMLYNERLNQIKENPVLKDIEFCNFVYNYYSSQYGVKKIADQKFLILILSVKKYSQILRINVFSRFLGLSEGNSNYSQEEFNKYIDVMDFINNISQAGTNYQNMDQDQKYVVPYIKAVHYISQFGDSRMKSEENAELRKDVEGLKWIDPNKTATVDFDAYMMRLLTTYKVLVNRTRQFVINAFNACDLDGNKKCNFQEWSLLNRHIESDKFDDDQLVSVFEQNADISEQGEDGSIEKNLSFDKFAVVSLEYELFSDEAQNKYLDITTPAQLKDKFLHVLSIWEGKKPIFQKGFSSLKNIDQGQKDEWLTIIKVLDDKLQAARLTNTNIKPLLIAYNILDKEFSMLEQDNLEQLLNPSLIM